MAAVVLGGAIIAFTSVPGLGNSVAGLFKSSDAGLIRYKAQKGKLPVVVTEKGSLESSKNIDVINEVEGMTTIISIVPEGTQVKKGDKVCELDSATLRDNLTNQEIATKRAESDLEQTKKNLEVAEISVKEYVEGTYPSEEQSALGQIKLAESELVKAKERLDWSDKNVKLGYVSPSANYADKLARDKAEFSLN